MSRIVAELQLTAASGTSVTLDKQASGESEGSDPKPAGFPGRQIKSVTLTLAGTADTAAGGGFFTCGRFEVWIVKKT